jgi:predicted transcriptional regulator
MSSSGSSYRDRIYIVKDIILKLIEHNELNQTALLSFCGLNLKKHKSILDELVSNGLAAKNEVTYGKRRVVVYKPTHKGLEFCTNILEPYEKLFPRRKSNSSIIIETYKEEGQEKIRLYNNAYINNNDAIEVEIIQ